MERLCARDFRALLQAVEELELIDSLDAFPRCALNTVRALIPVEIVTYNEVNPRRQRIAAVSNPTDALLPDGHERFAKLISQHPVIQFHARRGDQPTLKISDFLSTRQFHHLGLYQDFFRLLDVEYQLSVTLPSPAPVVIGIALNRGSPDFSERDRSLLNLLRPHLVAAYGVATLRDRLRAAEDARATRPEVWEGDTGELGSLRARLTRREAEVLTLVGHGRSNIDVADALCMSERTVGKHLEHIYGKLGVHNRTAALWAVQRRPDVRNTAAID